MTEFDRVQFQFFSQFVHLEFGHPQGLRCTKPAECCGRYIVGIHPVHILPDIGNEVRARGSDRAVAKDFVGGIHVCTGVGNHGCIRREKFSRLGGSPFCFDRHRVTFAMPDDRFLAAPDDLDRALQFHCRK